MTSKTVLEQPTFSSGEISPALYGRTDLQRYTSALRSCENFFVRAEGGARKRSGTKFICPVATHATQSKIVPFEFSTTQTYILEFSHLKMRVIKDGGLVLDLTETGCVISDGSPNALFTQSGHSLLDGETVFISAAGNELKSRYYTVSSKTANTFELTKILPETGVLAYADVGTDLTVDVSRVYEIVTTYTAAECQQIKYAQSADILYIAHPSHQPAKLSRTSHTAWTLADIVTSVTARPPVKGTSVWYNVPGAANGLFPDGVTTEKYVVTAFDDVVGQESAASATYTVSRNTVWTANHVNRLTWTAPTGASGTTWYNVYKESGGTYGFIGKVNHPAVTFDDTPIVPSTTVFPPENRDPFVDSNFPSTVTFFEDRLVWAASNGAPQTIYTSQSGDYENYNVSQTPVASDALEFTINARQVNKIEHMVPLDGLLLLTSGAVWSAAGSGENSPLAPDSIRVRVQSYDGAEGAVEPLFMGSTIIFLEDKAQTVRDLNYEFVSDRYKGNDLSVMSRHLFDGRTIVDWCWAKVPNDLLWMARDDGSVLTLTYMLEHDVRGWARHTFGGLVENFASVSEGDEDAVYMIIQRTVNGNSYRYIERIEQSLAATVEDNYYVDSGLTETGSAFTTVGGLWHLEGETVAVLADGNVVEDLVVASGIVTIPTAADKVHVGLPYTASLETLDLNVGSDGGAFHAQKRKTSKIFVRISNTRGLFAADSSDGVLNELKDQLYVPDVSLPELSEIVVIVPASDWGRKGRAYLSSPYPLPAEILSIMPLITVGS